MQLQGRESYNRETRRGKREVHWNKKKINIEILEGSPCRESCAPISVKSTSNFGTALSIVYTCETGHGIEWNSSVPNKERTHSESEVDFDLCAASIRWRSRLRRSCGTPWTSRAHKEKFLVLRGMGLSFWST